MVLQAMAVFEKQQSVLVDVGGVDRVPRGGASPPRKGDEQRIVEQRRGIDLAAGEGEREQHAIELAAMERLAGGAGWSLRADRA